jgi:pyrroline-5-carboxylate reductase
MNGSTVSVGFVGGGRIARIAVESWARAGRAPKVVASDPNPEMLAKLATAPLPVTVTTDNGEAAKQDIVFVALHPPQLGAVLPEVARSLHPEAVVVSLAPKWTLSRIAAGLGGFARLARVIPNAPSLVGAGFNPVSFAEKLPDDARSKLLALLEPWGQVPVVDETTLEAYAIIAAMGPTYLWPQLYRLMALGRDFGLSEDAARRAVAAMVHGCAAVIEQTGFGREQAMDLIPAKPLAGLEPAWDEAYMKTLTDLYAKLKP